MRTFWKIFIVSILVIAVFITALAFGNSINSWFDKTFISKDSKIVGEWSVDKLTISTEDDSFELTRKDYEKFVLKYEESRATKLEKEMYNVSASAFDQIFNFEKDGTMIETENGNENIYTWTFENRKVNIKNDYISLDGNYRNKTITFNVELSEEMTLKETFKRIEKPEVEEFSVVGEWNVFETTLENESDSFTLTAGEYEDFMENFDESEASELEKEMHEIADGMFLQKYVITEEKFEIHMFTGEEFECVAEFDYTINEDGNLVYSVEEDEEPMVVLIEDGKLINQQGSLEEMRLSQVFSKVVNA